MGIRNRVVAGGISLLIYAVISLLSSLPAKSLPSGVPDFIPHFLEYFLLAYFLLQVFSSPRHAGPVMAAALLLAVLGFLDEWHQRSVPGRFFSRQDLLVDMLGAAAGMAVLALLSRRRPVMRDE
jgi:VanZ family protein